MVTLRNLSLAPPPAPSPAPPAKLATAESSWAGGEGPDAYLQWMGLGAGEERKRGRDGEAWVGSDGVAAAAIKRGTKTLQVRLRKACVESLCVCVCVCVCSYMYVQYKYWYVLHAYFCIRTY